MISNLLLDDNLSNYNGTLLFSSNNSVPTSITFKPSYSNITFSACQNGEINFTPCGIYLNNAYKIDNGFVRNLDHSSPSTVVINDVNNRNMNVAFIDMNCTTYQELRIETVSNGNEDEDEQTDELNFSLYPNPTTNKFIMQMKSAEAGVKDISIYTSIGTEIFRLEKLAAVKTAIDLSSHPKGIYFVKVTEGEKTGVKKIVLM
jgi:hypothetical protein